jgi:Flp pilus assembly CpaE family ATPase
VGGELVASPDGRAIWFPGWVPVGHAVRDLARARGCRVQLELGGHNPLFFGSDAVLERAAEAAYAGAFWSAGQKCTATRRIYVQDAVYGTFRDAFLARIERGRVGDPADPDTEVGPLVNEGPMDDVLAAVERGRAEGGTVLAGGERDGEGFLVSPTVFESVADDAYLSCEEVFGPVTSLYRYGTLDEAIERAASRLGNSGGTGSLSSIVTFIGAKGGVGTTTLAVNCAVELAGKKKSTIMVDLKQGLGDVALFLGVRSRYSIVDALDAEARLDREFLTGLVAKHVSGVELLPGSDQFERPASSDGPVVEQVFRLLSARYEYAVVDAGSQITACGLAAIYMSELINVVINPDVPSIRSGQRIIERISQMGSCGERVRVLLNRAAAPYPIPLTQIEEALGQKVHLTFPPDYRTVATALNSGVPLTFSDNSDMAEQFRRLTDLILNPAGAAPKAATPKRGGLGLPRFASMW